MAPVPRWHPVIWMLGVILVGSIAWFYFWTAHSAANPYRFERESRGYYNMLVDGFRSGHLWLNAEPPPELLNAANPYDPALAHHGLHDTTFYRGKYYLYFGVTPAVVLFLPFKALTGLHCPENFATALFGVVGLVCNSALAALLLRRFFPQRHPLWWLAAIAILGFGNLGGLLLRRAAFWDVPIAAGYAFGSLSLLFAVLALTTPHATRYLALVGLCYGLAAGCRPLFLFGLPGFALLLWLLSDRTDLRWREWLRRNLGRIAKAATPLALVLLGLAWYNYARFGSPTEFGIKWQLTGYDMAHWKLLDLANVPVNLWYYFVAPAHWTWYFPFAQVSGPAPLAGGPAYYGQDNPYGLLSNLPLTAFGCLAVLAAGTTDKRAARFVAFVGLMFAGNAFVLMLYSAAAGRYAVDIAPYATLLGLCGVWLALERWEARRWRRRLFLAAVTVAAVVTVVFNFFVGFQFNRIFELNNPVGYDRAAHFFNLVPAAAARVVHLPSGPMRMRVRFPSQRSGAYEPLVSTGWYFLGDLAFVKYGDRDQLEFGFAHHGGGEVMGPPVPVDLAREHLLEIEMGSLLPPAGHPAWDGRLPQEIRQFKRRLRVALDGAEVLVGEASFHESSPRDVKPGENRFGFIAEKRFSGQILEVTRVPVPPPHPRPASPGAAWLKLRLPAGKGGRPEPLLTTGVPGQGDVLYIRHDADGAVRFGHDHWGYAAAESESIPWDPRQSHVLECWIGSLRSTAGESGPRWLPGGAPPANPARACLIRLDGQLVWATERDFYPADPSSTVLLDNPIGSSACAARFGGWIDDWRWLPATR